MNIDKHLNYIVMRNENKKTKEQKMEKTYLTLKETAKLLRAALKKNFPGVKFSVRSESFAGGSAIRVSYTDGPLQKAVEKVVNCYAYGGFDGMIDLSFHVNQLCEIIPLYTAIKLSRSSSSNSLVVLRIFSCIVV